MPLASAIAFAFGVVFLGRGVSLLGVVASAMLPVTVLGAVSAALGPTVAVAGLRT